MSNWWHSRLKLLIVRLSTSSSLVLKIRQNTFFKELSPFIHPQPTEKISDGNILQDDIFGALVGPSYTCRHCRLNSPWDPLGAPGACESVVEFADVSPGRHLLAPEVQTWCKHLTLTVVSPLVTTENDQRTIKF